MTDPSTPRLIPTTVHGRYLVRPAPAGSSAPLLVGFHGYGENADDHLAALERVPGTDAWHLVAVQALHPFYKRDGSVVASWMTKLDREAAIVDNVAYVERVVAAVREELDTNGVLVFAGFSQGVAMAYRAAAALPSSGVIALAGDVPPEVAPGDLPPVLLGRGRRDEWYDGGKEDDDLARLEAAGVAVETCVFDGGHEWTDDFYRAAEGFLGRVG